MAELRKQCVYVKVHLFVCACVFVSICMYECVCDCVYMSTNIWVFFFVCVFVCTYGHGYMLYFLCLCACIHVFRSLNLTTVGQEVICMSLSFIGLYHGVLVNLELYNLPVSYCILYKL